MAEHAELKLPCVDQVQMGIYPSIDWCQAERELVLNGWQTVHERARPGYALTIAGSGHISFLDVPFLPIEPGSMMAGGLASVRIEAGRAWRIVCDYVLAFFARHLNGAPAPLLDGPSPDYPEVMPGSPRDLLDGSAKPAG
jgi:hypothetical protein